MKKFDQTMIVNQRLAKALPIYKRISANIYNIQIYTNIYIDRFPASLESEEASGLVKLTGDDPSLISIYPICKKAAPKRSRPFVNRV